MQKVAEHVTHALELTGQRPPSTTAGWVSSLLRDIPVQFAHRSGFVKTDSTDVVERELLAEAATAMHHLAERSYYNFEALPMIAASLSSVNLAERSGVDVRVAQPYGMLGMTVGISKLHRLGNRYFEIARRAATATGDEAGM